jgi:hypothetical protein
MRGTSSEEWKMRRFLTAMSRGAQALALVLVAAGCGGTRESFIGGRVRDACDQVWPVCATTAGCILGQESYTEGRFPGQARVIVQLREASTVRLRFYLDEVTAAGEETAVVFHEEGCRARVRKSASGRVVQDSVEKTGEYAEEAELTGVGDHLVEFSSDMRARYAVKVEVEPLRGQQ